MKKIILTIGVVLLAFGSVQSQEKKEKKATFATQILHNSVAGFYPIFFGNFETNKNYDITIYSIFWTNPSFGNLASGSDLLLETGVGLGFKLLDKSLYVNPSLGISHGKFSSDSKGTKIGEGLVPNLFVAYNKGLFDFEGYIAYYKSLREDDDIKTKDFLLNWAAPGINVSKRVVLGAYYESFGITRQESGDPLLIYRWLGGSLKLRFDKGISFRVSAGATLKTEAGTADDFYKVAAFIPL
ncbi:DUF6733 family protein [Aquimarina hainanensis]|uniref:DUF6733 family protein n=1 Tax=Aquimarina hainanensis TaxID=1578017 RepID=A0ABW5ND60_9FLAO|nr:DUF6733 family protein [Aquimarina sp. TRL1]QKX06977.1 hypothetical protein HN014_19330 [Aquimarina sp. TRL1]